MIRILRHCIRHQARLYTTTTSEMMGKPVHRTYEGAIELLNSLQSNASVIEQVRKDKLFNNQSLPQMTSFMQRMGYSLNDLDRLNAIHIAGTKGKGSTASFTDSILRQIRKPGHESSSFPLKTGLFTSPHLVHVNERIRLNGLPLERPEFVHYFYQVWDQLQSIRDLEHPEFPQMPTYFRFLNILAFHVFLSERVDVCICEVGVGGEYDSTNVIQNPVVCGITTLGLDHQAILGSTIDQIAWHKSGIMKTHVPCFTVPQVPEAKKVLENRAIERGCELITIDQPSAHIPPGAVLGLDGGFQITNAALAIHLSKMWCKKLDINLSDDAIQTGLKVVDWPGRAQRLVSLATPSMTWYLDGAHTPESMLECTLWFQSRSSPDAERVLLFNCTHGRDGASLLRALWEMHAIHPVKAIIFTTNEASHFTGNLDMINHNEPAAVDEAGRLTVQEALRSTWMTFGGGSTPIRVSASIPESIQLIKDHYAPCEVLVTGSLYLVGGTLKLLDPRFDVKDASALA